MPPPAKDEAREARLAQALKANLRRRKAQARARSNAEETASADKAGPPEADAPESR